MLLFWRTTPTLMVGKYQNILEEINKPYADAHKIRLVRRMSGGGTIYTDLGGWQFTFIEHSDQTQIDFPSTSAPSSTRCASWARTRASTGATIC